MIRYFIWKDPARAGEEDNWLEISHDEFIKLKRKNRSRRFIPSYDEEDENTDFYLYEATIANFNDWNLAHMKYIRHDFYLHRDYDVIYLDDYVDSNDNNGLTWAETIPDTRIYDAECERLYQEKRTVLILRLLKEIKKLPEKDQKLVYALFLNPNGNMTETEYASAIGLTQQAVSKRKLKIVKKIQAKMVVKK